MNTLDTGLDSRIPLHLDALPRAQRLVLELLSSLTGGSLDLHLPDGSHIRAGHGPVAADWHIHHPSVFGRILAKGDIGLAEAYMDGDWDSDRLADLLTLFALHRAELETAIHGRALALLVQRLLHLLRANTRQGARRNIQAHYDLGNDFYSLWLDPGMTYSGAIFASPREPLEAAQRRKYRRLLEQVGVRRGDIILEIGCGWGGLAEVAVTEFGCLVHGLTLSPSQLAFARARAEAGGWSARADFELRDYRDVKGHYDHILSIEMLEAVGERYWPRYFRQLATLLRPGGRIGLQAITIRDDLFPRYRRGTDFIQRHVFPGGMLPSPGRIQELSREAGLEVERDFAFGLDYAATLGRWRSMFEVRVGEVSDLGYGEEFIRLWRLYLAYCEAGFRSGSTDVHQYVLARVR